MVFNASNVNVLSKSGVGVGVYHGGDTVTSKKDGARLSLGDDSE